MYSDNVVAVDRQADMRTYPACLLQVVSATTSVRRIG
jgi:hypothetical protein